MYELGEWLIFVARLFMLAVGFLGALAAVGAAVDWLIGRIGRQVRAYSLLIEFALNYKQFKQYKSDKQDIRRTCGNSD